LESSQPVAEKRIATIAKEFLTDRKSITAAP
jgi:hypothetical protein